MHRRGCKEIAPILCSVCFFSFLFLYFFLSNSPSSVLLQLYATVQTMSFAWPKELTLIYLLALSHLFASLIKTLGFSKIIDSVDSYLLCFASVVMLICFWVSAFFRVKIAFSNPPKPKPCGKLSQ